MLANHRFAVEIQKFRLSIVVIMIIAYLKDMRSDINIYRYRAIASVIGGKEMKKYLLPRNGKFYKANMHTHTTVSDGKLTPEEAKEVFKSLGYSIVAFTDHEVVVPHPELRDDDFLPITSYEISINSAWNTFIKCYHLNIYMPEPDRDVTGTFCLPRVREQWLHQVNDGMKERALSRAPTQRSARRI